jgi:hypothetical protein
MALCGEAARQRMLRRAAGRLWEDRASTMTVRGKRHARLLTKLVSLRIPEEDAAAQVRDMHLWPAAQVRDACSCRVIPSAYSTRIYIGRGKTRADQRRCCFTPALLLLYSCFTPASYIICMHNMFMIYICIYICMLYSCFTPGVHIYIYKYVYICIYVCIHTYIYIYNIYIYMIYIYIYMYMIYSCFTPALFIMCIICLWSIYIYTFRYIDIDIDICFTPGLHTHTKKHTHTRICIYALLLLYVCLTTALPFVHIYMCFTSALLLLHYCFTLLYKC